MKTMFKIVIIMMALGCYAFTPTQKLQIQKGGEMVVILDRSTPVQLEFNACHFKAGLKWLVIEDADGNEVFGQGFEGVGITINAQYWSVGRYTVKLSVDGCQEQAEVKITS